MGVPAATLVAAGGLPPPSSGGGKAKRREGGGVLAGGGGAARVALSELLIAGAKLVNCQIFGDPNKEFGAEPA